jgi:predicted DNA-binding transcriptional regulator YafY
LVKIGAVLPGSERDRLHRTEIHAARDALPDATRVTLDRLDGTVEARQVLRLGYRDENGQETVRDVRPLGLWFWGKVWTLIAWCELRNDFRMFRLDRMQALGEAGRSFKPEPGQRLVDFHRRKECRGTGPAA